VSAAISPIWRWRLPLHEYSGALCKWILGGHRRAAGPVAYGLQCLFEVYLDGRWFTFDARHNVPRIGRITVARGRDAADAALVTSFGPHTLTKFRVWTEEIDDAVSADLTRRTA